MNDYSVLAFTGPRAAKLCGWDKAAYQGLVDTLALALKEYYDQGVRKFISGGAQGFDQLAFWAVHKMKTQFGLKDVVNAVYVPFQGQEGRWADTGCFGKGEYAMMLKLADEVKGLAVVDTNDKKAVTQALMSRNSAMIEDAGTVLALYDKDDWGTASGGTSDAMRKSKAAGKNLHQARFVIENNQVKLTAFEAVA